MIESFIRCNGRNCSRLNHHKYVIQFKESYMWFRIS